MIISIASTEIAAIAMEDERWRILLKCGSSLIVPIAALGFPTCYTDYVKVRDAQGVEVDVGQCPSCQEGDCPLVLVREEP